MRRSKKKSQNHIKKKLNMLSILVGYLVGWIFEGVVLFFFFRFSTFSNIFLFFLNWIENVEIRKGQRGRSDIYWAFIIFFKISAQIKILLAGLFSTEVWLSHTYCFHQYITSSIIFVHACAWGLSPFYVIPDKTAHKFPKNMWKLTFPLHHWCSSILQNFLLVTSTVSSWQFLKIWLEHTKLVR